MKSQSLCPEQKCNVGGRKCYVDGRRHHFVALLYATPVHLFHVGIWESRLGLWGNVAPVQRNIFPVCRQRIGIPGDDAGERKTHPEGRKYCYVIRKNDLPAQRDETDDHPHHFPGRVDCISNTTTSCRCLTNDSRRTTRSRRCTGKQRLRISLRLCTCTCECLHSTFLFCTRTKLTCHVSYRLCSVTLWSTTNT